MANFIQMRGAQIMKENLRRKGIAIIDAVETALYQETQVEATEVKKRTPVDTGALRASIHVVGPIRNGRTVYTLIVAGGPAAPYAFEVHENLEAFHKVGEAKYLESVIMESRPFMARRIQKRMRINGAA